MISQLVSLVLTEKNLIPRQSLLDQTYLQRELPPKETRGMLHWGVGSNKWIAHIFIHWNSLHRYHSKVDDTSIPAIGYTNYPTGL